MPTNATHKTIKKYKLTKVFSFAAFFLFLATFLIRMYYSGVLAVKNKDLKNLYEHKVQLEKEISLMKFEDSKLSALNYIESRALKLGFQPMTDTLLSLEPNTTRPVAVVSAH